MKRPSMRKIAEEAGCHIDTIFRIKRDDNKPSPNLAKRLEEVTGIDRRRWLWPEDFGDPWLAFKEKYEKKNA